MIPAAGVAFVFVDALLVSRGVFVSVVHRGMGAKASREAEAKRIAEVEAWHARLQRYFHNYNLKPNPHRTAALVGRIVEDRAVWIALLTKYGPELDPPFDQPLAPVAADIGVRRRRVHMTSAAVLSSKEQWIRRLKRFFGKYKPEMSEDSIRKYVAAIPFSELPLAWEVLVEQYGPEPLGAIDASTGDTISDRRSFKSTGSAVASALELAARCEFKRTRCGCFDPGDKKLTSLS
jgi:hypothetical protein